MSAPRVSDVLTAIARDPAEVLIRRWNWKAAATSALTRGGLFFVTNLAAGFDAARAALATELVLRGATSGMWGAVTEAFRFVRPRRHALLAVIVILPVASHALELLVHWVRGTPRLALSIGASMAFTAVSTAFNLFAMQRGALVVGEGRASLAADLRRMPALVYAFVLEASRAAVRLAASGTRLS